MRRRAQNGFEDVQTEDRGIRCVLLVQVLNNLSVAQTSPVMSVSQGRDTSLEKAFGYKAFCAIYEDRSWPNYIDVQPCNQAAAFLLSAILISGFLVRVLGLSEKEQAWA